jgi:sugar lactone lactonase YvrE
MYLRCSAWAGAGAVCRNGKGGHTGIIQLTNEQVERLAAAGDKNNVIALTSITAGNSLSETGSENGNGFRHRRGSLGSFLVVMIDTV